MNHSALELFIWGHHPVNEAIGSPRTRVHEVWIGEGAQRHLGDVEMSAKKKGIRTQVAHRDVLSKKAGTDKHQNVVAKVTLEVLSTVDEWFSISPPSPKKFQTMLILDSLEDPQNFGSLLRSGHFFGVDAVITTKDRAAPITGTVAKTSAGALFSVPMIRAVNLARELDACGEANFWRVGLVADAESVFSGIKLAQGHVALVVGSEDTGLRRLTAQKCDQLARLTPTGGRDSLNAAIAGAVALYEIARQKAS